MPNDVMPGNVLARSDSSNGVKLHLGGKMSTGSRVFCYLLPKIEPMPVDRSTPCFNRLRLCVCLDNTNTGGVVRYPLRITVSAREIDSMRPPPHKQREGVHNVSSK